jgi:hypothetical protein
MSPQKILFLCSHPAINSLKNYQQIMAHESPTILSSRRALPSQLNQIPGRQPCTTLASAPFTQTIQNSTPVSRESDPAESHLSLSLHEANIVARLHCRRTDGPLQSRLTKGCFHTADLRKFATGFHLSPRAFF